MARERRPRRNSHNGKGSLPPPWLSGWFDPELKELFEKEPELYETAHLLRASRPEAQPDDQYRRRLRASLMAEAEGAVGRQGPLRRWFMPRPRHLAWGGAAAGVALVAATALALFSTHMQDHQTVTAFSDVAALHSVSPEQAVTVAFNQPMDHAAVVAGLRIQPATEITTAWQGNSLVITPVHHFAGNTPYTVSIAQAALRTSIGTVAAAPLVITFGTAATPPPVGQTSSTPELQPAQLGQAASGSGVAFAPDGSVVAEAGIVGTAGATAPPSGTAAPTSTPTAAQSPAATATGSGVPAGPALVSFAGPGAQPVVLGKAAEAVGFSPDGSRLAVAEAAGEGASQVIVAAADGSNASVVATSGSPVVGVAWPGAGRLVYATSDAIHTIDLPGTSATVTLPSSAGPVTALSPDGRHAYLAPAAGTGGILLDIADGSTRTLTGSVSQVAFSGDGATVAWVDQSGGQPRLLTSPVDRDAPAPVSTLDPGSQLTLAAVSHDGGEVAYSVSGPSQSEQLVVAQLPSGAALALGPATHVAAFAPQGGSIAYVAAGASGSVVELAPIPGYVRPPAAMVPAPAIDALNAFVAAQVSGNAGRLHDLAGSGFDPVALTPKGLSRAYTIDASSSSPGKVSADVDLVVDPTSHHQVTRVAAETLTLTRSATGDGYLVTALDVAALHDQPAGPHVVRVAGGPSASHYVVQVTFDSDLAAASVPGAITVSDDSGTVLHGTTVYDANTRVATVTLDSMPAGPVTVKVDTSLMDVSRQALAATVTAVTGG
ncbi:MAG: Ig-like domain-containing protein [Candidatus Dormibacteraeota bacterium]|nr:Ig-like domain-containing protein [Candidatus Dormibacteraeota bacterium]MBV9525112.1 Ig-like domain-containing protein [Candidatus Dormibacteraeota bacterium]